MARDTLLDFFEDFSGRSDTFIVHDDGYRVRRASYRDVAGAARVMAARLSAAGVAADDKIVVWSENRTEWVVAFWACLLVRAVVVPVDFRASADLLARISAIVRARIVLVGEEVEVPAEVNGEIWKLTDVVRLPDAPGDEPALPPAPHGATTASEAVNPGARWPKSSSRREQRPNRRASRSRTATCSPTSSRSNARWRSTGATSGPSIRSGS